MVTRVYFTSLIKLQSALTPLTIVPPAIFLNLFLICGKEFLGGLAAVRIRLFPDCKTAERGTTELKVEQIASRTNLSMSQATIVITR